jgi:hypothetical protein
LVCQVGSTTLKYHLQAIEDLHRWLLERGDWVPLGAADEGKPAAEGTVEAWGRDPENPGGGWYGLRKGYRGRFVMYLPPLLEALGLAELTHENRNNSVRAVAGPAALAARPPKPAGPPSCVLPFVPGSALWPPVLLFTRPCCCLPAAYAARLMVRLRAPVPSSVPAGAGARTLMLHSDCSGSMDAGR